MKESIYQFVKAYIDAFQIQIFKTKTLIYYFFL